MLALSLLKPPHGAAPSVGAGGHVAVFAVVGVIVAVAVIAFLWNLLSKGKPALPASQPGAGGPPGVTARAGGTGDAGVVMDPKKYFMADDDVRKRVSMQCAQAVAPVIGGSVREDDGDLQVHGKYRDRPTRFEISVTFGTAILQVRAARTFTDAPDLSLEYDKDGPPAGEPQQRDDWDDRDGKKQKLFFSPHVRLEERPKQLAERKAMLERLPPGLCTSIVNALEQQGDGRLMFVVDSVRWFMPGSVFLSKDAPSLFTQRLEMMRAFLDAIEQAWPDRAQLAATWPAMTGRLLAVQPTGTLINMNPEVHVFVELQGPQGPYRAQTKAVVPQMSIPAFQPGAALQVRVNPTNPEDVAFVF